MSTLILIGLVSFSFANTPSFTNNLFTGCGDYYGSGAVTISGFVRNKNTNAIIQGATVTLSASDTGTVCQTTTSSNTGAYGFPNKLTPNYYIMRATKTGFQPYYEYAYFYNPGWPYVFTYNILMTP